MNLPRLFGLFSLSIFAFACANSERTEYVKKPSEETSSTIPTNATIDAESFCTSMCDRQQSCDKGLDHQTCKNACTNQNAAVFPKLREDVVSLIVECFGSKDCKTVLQGDVVGTCASEAVASVAPSAAAKTYCDKYSDAKRKCGTTIPTATCLNGAKLYDDEAIAQAQNCSGRPCGEIEACVAAAFGEIGTGKVTKPDPQSCSTAQFSDLGSCSSCAATSCCTEASACAADSTCRTLMRYCSTQYSGTSTCSTYYSSASTESRELATTYFGCAQSKCSSGCGFSY